MTTINKLSKRVLCLILAFIFTLCGMPVQTYAKSNVNAMPSIVKSYKENNSTFRVTSDSRFFIVSEAAPAQDIIDTVNLVSSEFAKESFPSSAKLSVIWGTENEIKTGDIVIIIDSKMESESYKLNLKDTAKLSAGDSDGVFYGLRTLLGIFMSKDSNTLKGCIIKDSPAVNERTVHLDCARKYYSRKWIENLIKDMSQMKYNALELHFSEDQALRLESKTFPWLAGALEGSEKYLTQKDVARICRTARKYHIEIIPSFDSPGHMDYIVKTYAEYVKAHPNFKFTYNGKTYSKKTKGFSNISNYFQYKGDKSAYNYRGIDITNPTALAFTNALIDEYADFFAGQGCTKFNIGGDELLGWSEITVGGKTFNFNTKWNALEHWEKYAKKHLKIKNGSSSDTFINYLNTLSTRLEKKNYSVRVWNDEINRNKDQHISLKKSIQILYWSNDFASIDTLKKKGHSFYNAISTWCYYVVRKDSQGNDLMDTTYINVTGKSIYKKWNPKSFASPSGKKKTVPSKQYAGAYFCIWGDMPEYKSASKIRKETRSRMWANSVKMWNPNVNTKKSGNKKALSYSEFVKFTKLFDYQT